MDARPSAGNSADLNLDATQVKVLLNMIQNQSLDRTSGEYSTLSWIIDTGASQHVTGDESCLKNIRPILGCPVGLPDRTHVMATMEGQVFLSGGLILNHVLYVPSLLCNLISVSHLIDDSHCIIQFTNFYVLYRTVIRGA